MSQFMSLREMKSLSRSEVFQQLGMKEPKQKKQVILNNPVYLKGNVVRVSDNVEENMAKSLKGRRGVVTDVHFVKVTPTKLRYFYTVQMNDRAKPIKAYENQLQLIAE